MYWNRPYRLRCSKKRMSQELLFRLATPADVDALTELHCASFSPEDNVPAMLGKDYVLASFRWRVIGKQAYMLVTKADMESL